MEAKKNPQVDLSRKKGLFFTIGMVITCLFVISAFEWKTYAEITKVNIQDEETFEEILDIPITNIQPPPPPPVLQQPEVIEVPNDEEIDEEIKVNLEVEFKEIVPPAPPIKPKENVIPKPIEEPEEKIFLFSEEQAVPVGGNKAFYRYVQKAMKYPAQARRMGVEGKVFIQFVVEKDGSLTDIKILKGIGSGCDEEAVRVLKAAPKWKPGKQRGKAVRVRRSLPIKFNLQ